MKKAACIQQTTLSDFVLGSALKAAQEVIKRRKLAGQTHFILPADRWKAFCAALDAPPKSKPALRKLLAEPCLFDDQ